MRITEEQKQHAGQVIKSCRKNFKINQNELAQRLSVSQPLVSLWEKGKIVPSLHDLVAIEKALNYAEGEILLHIAYPKQNTDTE